MGRLHIPTPLHMVLPHIHILLRTVPQHMVLHLKVIHTHPRMERQAMVLHHMVLQPIPIQHLLWEYQRKEGYLTLS